MLMEQPYRIVNDTIHLDLKAVPRASKTECAGISGGRLRIRIAAPPEHGKANDALRELLSRILGCAKRELTLTGGEKSTKKTIALPLAYRVQLDTLIVNEEKNA